MNRTVPSAAFEAAAEFDAHAEQYEQELQQGLRYSGEDSTYFARGRVDALRLRLQDSHSEPRVALDFGCGRGSATPLLLELAGVERVIGVDVSKRLLALAAREFGSGRIEFRQLEQPLGVMVELAYCNGVFHHIPVAARADAARYVFATLQPGGLFALCENNPWNPGTRLVMRSIPFDRDAETLTPRATRRLLRSEGFEVIHTDFLFFFPHALHKLRRVELHLKRLPLGAQYMVVARKPQ
jgi:SAM-dependent methyltransferase